jgi:hypothetical protein
LRKEQDLWHQLQKGERGQIDSNQAGFKGRRLEQGDRDLERFRGGRNFNQGRLQ